MASGLVQRQINDRILVLELRRQEVISNKAQVTVWWPEPPALTSVSNQRPVTGHTPVPGEEAGPRSPQATAAGTGTGAGLAHRMPA